MTKEQKQAERAASRILKHKDLQLHPVERGVYDVFDSEGFRNHGRYRHYKGVWHHMSGIKIDKTRFPTFQ